MKKLSIFLMAFVTFLGINACSSDDDVVFIAQPDPEGISFTNSFTSSYILTPATTDNVAERFVWNQVDFDAPTNITYELQGSTTADFASFDILGETTGNNLAVSVQQLLDLATDAELDADPETEAPNTGQLHFRVRAFAGNGGGTTLDAISEVQSITVVLPEDTGEPSLRNFFLVGDVTAAGWSTNNNNTPLFRDPANADVYYFTGRFKGGGDTEGFKLLEMLGNETWQPQWGLDGDNLTSSEILGEDPSAFPVDADGYYAFTVNADEMTYSFEPYDVSDAATYDIIGLVGDGTSVGWPGDANPTPDIQLTQSEFDPHLWYVNDITLTDGPIKFRANLAWDVNWGADTFPSGLATQNGPDIPATAGVYDLWFNDITGRYILIPQVSAE